MGAPFFCIYREEVKPVKDDLPQKQRKSTNLRNSILNFPPLWVVRVYGEGNRCAKGSVLLCCHIKRVFIDMWNLSSNQIY